MNASCAKKLQNRPLLRAEDILRQRVWVLRVRGPLALGVCMGGSYTPALSIRDDQIVTDVCGDFCITNIYNTIQYNTFYFRQLGP